MKQDWEHLPAEIALAWIGPYPDPENGTAEDPTTIGSDWAQYISIRFNVLTGGGIKQVACFKECTTVSLYAGKDWLVDFPNKNDGQSSDVYTRVYVEAARQSMQHQLPIAVFEWK